MSVDVSGVDVSDGITPEGTAGGGDARRVASPLAERILAGMPYVTAAALLLILVLPGFVYPYLFDDFDFLVRALTFTPGSLLPDPSVLFYRPLSRDLQFWLLQNLSPHGPVLAHALNTFYLFASVLLVVWIGMRTLGRREGALAGLYFAGFGQLPLLVAWASGAQDALAILFTLVALACERARRHGWALAAAALAVLSKETAVVALPALALAHALFRDRNTSRGGRWSMFDYLILAIVWGAADPAVHRLAQPGAASGVASYIGFTGVRSATNVLGFVTLLFNLPSPGFRVEWPVGLTAVAGIGVAIAIAGVSLLPQAEGASGTAVAPVEGPEPRKRFLTIALILALAPLLATSLLVRNWAPYYAAYSAMGAAWLLAAFTARMRRFALTLFVALFVAAGVLVRGMVVAPGVTTERSLAPAASALLQLEPQFRALAPTMPTGSQVLVASQVSGAASVHVHLYSVPTLQEWYRDPTLRVVRPELREAGRPGEFLFWINRELHVYRVDLKTMLPRSVTKAADFDEYQGLMRRYTRGLAESGQLRGAIEILLRMPHRTEPSRWWDRRLAASYLFSFGYMSDGNTLLAGAPPIDARVAATMVAELLAQPGQDPARYDLGTMHAFGLKATDPDALRLVMRVLTESGNVAAVRFALRLQALRPNDPDAQKVLKGFGLRLVSQRITTAPTR